MSARRPECGPAAVETVTRDDEDAAREGKRRARRGRIQRGSARSPRPRSWPSASTATTTAPREDDEREEEVRHHQQRVEVELIVIIAERRLGDRPEERRDRPATSPSAAA